VIFVEQLLDELKEASKMDRSVDAFSFPEDTSPDEDQQVEPVSSTFTAGQLVNIYRVTDGNHFAQYIFSTHGDGGCVCGYGGPYTSVEAIQMLFDPVEEGWTDY
jgi:hypothetical protein